MKTAVLATNNAHKVREFQRAFAEYGIDIELKTLREIGFSEEIDENADTFEGNAYIKAKTVCEYSGMLTIADDSGLSVDFLDGEPGVYSARYSGENATDGANNAKLLGKLENVPYEKRTAHFVCTICVCRPDGKRLFVSGKCDGKILGSPKGAGTFGYDPLFYYEPLKKTFAELDGKDKDSVSHRGNAIRELLKHRDFLDDTNC